MRRILALVVVATIAVTSCTTRSDTSRSTTTSTTAIPCQRVRIAALGDSYTAGTGIDVGSWPEQFADALSTDCDIIDLVSVAGEGWNTKRLSRELDRLDDAGPHDVIILAIGANDVVLGFGEENFREGLDLLAGHIERLSRTGTELLVLSIPDFRVSPWGRDRSDRNYPVERYNEVLAEYAATIGATFVDITTTSARALEDPTLIAPDDLHFSADMYTLWVDVIRDVIGDR